MYDSDQKFHQEFIFIAKKCQKQAQKSYKLFMITEPRKHKLFVYCLMSSETLLIKND